MNQSPRTPDSTAAEEVIRVGEHYYVLAVSSRTDDRTRVLKHGDTFAIFDRLGDILASGMRDHGLFHAGTRHLSRLDLTINHLRPLLLSSNLDRENMFLGVDMTNPDLAVEGRIIAPRGTVHLLRTTLLWEGVLYEQLQVGNFGLHPLSFHLKVRFDADFADMFEIRGVHRQRHGRRLEPRVVDDRTLLRYDGLDGVRRTTLVSCDLHSDACRMRPDHVEVDIHLAPGERRSIELSFACLSEPIPEAIDASDEREAVRAGMPALLTYAAAVSNARARVESMHADECRVECDNERFNDWVHRSYADLRLMIAETPHGPYPYAGVPWFSTPFGRDGVITALQTLWVAPRIARGVLSFLAATQADETDPRRDAEPGKIIHEVRQGEMPALGEVPYARYYGSVDSTPLFVMLAGEYLRVSGDTALTESLWPHVERALAWIVHHADHDGDGFIDYKAASPTGLANQGWKDSHDSIFHEDGTLAEPPVALCEVQGYAYAAFHAGAEIAQALGRTEVATSLAARAQQLKDCFAERFWDDQMQTYVVALDAAKRPCRVATSNAGHLLFTGIASEEHARRIIDDMLSTRFFSGWGVRTLASDQPRYNPMSYHNGSVWPHDTALIALGMARYGRPEGAARLLTAMLDVSMAVELHRLPELFCGFSRRAGECPIGYPVSCAPQSWAAGAVFMMLQACLGLTVRGDHGEVICHTPKLPEFLRWVRVHRLHAGPGGAMVDLIFRRKEDDVAVNVLRRDTGVRVVVVK